MRGPKILILTVDHGAGHQRVASALRKAFIGIQSQFSVEVVNALQHCACRFRVYYDSYEVPLNYWPALWGWIEQFQHAGTSTGPAWLYRRGGRPLTRFIQEFDPEIMVATEVGLCELAAMAKRVTEQVFYLVGVPPGADVDRAWAQPEVDLYVGAAGDAAAQWREQIYFPDYAQFAVGGQDKVWKTRNLNYRPIEVGGFTELFDLKQHLFVEPEKLVEAGYKSYACTKIGPAASCP